MRVNHTGEVCAQALVARNAILERCQREVAVEEYDYLLWCAERTKELHSRPSVLNPGWFAGSVAISF